MKKNEERGGERQRERDGDIDRNSYRHRERYRNGNYIFPYPVVCDQEISHCVAFTLLLPLDLDGDVAVDHHPVAGPVLGTLFLKWPP